MIEWSQTLINLANTNLRLNIKDQKITDYSLQLFDTGINIIIPCSPVLMLGFEVVDKGQQILNWKETDKLGDIKGSVIFGSTIELKGEIKQKSGSTSILFVLGQSIQIEDFGLLWFFCARFPPREASTIIVKIFWNVVYRGSPILRVGDVTLHYSSESNYKI